MPTIEFPRVYGGNLEFYQDETSPIILLSGGLGTGKSFAICLKLIYLCLANPGMQIGLVRRYRASLSTTILPLFDELYYRLYPNAQKILPTSRTKYRFFNGSEVAVFGLDNPIRFFGSNFHYLYISEVVEVEEEILKDAAARVRKEYVLPITRQVYLDTNPSSPDHYLLQWEKEGRLKHYKSRHQDNPSVDAEYLKQLELYTGYRKERLVLGNWVAAEGLIFENYENALTEESSNEGLHLAGVDFGYTDPASIVFSRVANNVITVNDVIKQTKTKIEDILEHVTDAKKYTYICDNSRPDSIADLRRNGYNAVGCKKGAGSILRGINIINYYIDTNKLKIFTPTSQALITEMKKYAWDQKKKETPIDEDNHAIDALRYLVDFASTKSESRSEVTKPQLFEREKKVSLVV